jgi:RNA polymerase sigma factor (sigma-70 family)
MSHVGEDGPGLWTADDATVIERSVLDPELFGIIFDRHAPHIHRYLLRRLGPESADDLAAETFLIAFRKRRRYDPDERNARPWLYGIATRQVGQHRRDEVRRLRLRLAVGADRDDTCHADRVAAVVTAQAVRPTLLAALVGLAAPERDVLLLVAWEDLSYEETASALDIPVGTVRSRLHRARQRIRAALNGSDPTSIKER